MNQYRNVKSGMVIKTTGKVTGKNWEPVEEAKLPPVEDTPAEDPPVEDPAEEDTVEETADEEAPAEKPKTSRRGKK